MFQRILVPLDGSTRAESAVPIAARIAQFSGGSVFLLQVAAIPIDLASDKKPAEIYSQDVVDKGIASAKRYLDGVATSDKLAGTKAETTVVTGAVAPSILAAMHSLQSDLVVLCSHGYTGFQRWALGSVAQKVVHHSPVPVLLLHDGGPGLAIASGRPLRAVVPLDGSSLSESALEPAAQLVAALAPATQGAMHLLRVVDIPSSYGKFRTIADSYFDADMRAEAKREDEQYLQSVAKRFAEGELAQYHLAVTTAVAIDPDVAEAIVQTAEQAARAERFGSCLIAMSTHGRGGLERWVLGSVAERVLHSTKLPLLVVHPTRGTHGSHQETEAAL